MPEQYHSKARTRLYLFFCRLFFGLFLFSFILVAYGLFQSTMLTVEETNRSLNSEIVLHHLQISCTTLRVNTQKAPGEQKEALNRELSLDLSKDVFPW